MLDEVAKLLHGLVFGEVLQVDAPDSQCLLILLIAHQQEKLDRGVSTSWFSYFSWAESNSDGRFLAIGGNSTGWLFLANIEYNG